MNLGNKIYTLRKEKQLTQEKLALAVGVSTPAVSKWETGATYPDITLLAPIARVLGTSLDNLLSFESELSKQELDVIVTEISESFDKEGFRSGYAKCKAYLKEYPNSDSLKMELGPMVIKYAYTMEDDYSEEEYNKVIQDNIQLYEEVKNSTDKVLSMTACVWLISSYMRSGELEKAEELLDQLPKDEINANRLAPTLHLLKGDMETASNLAAQALLGDLQNILSSVMTLHTIAIRTKNYEKSLQYANTYLSVVKEFQLMNASTAYDMLINTYLHTGETRKAAECFSRMIDSILTLDFSYKEHPIFSNISRNIVTTARESIVQKSQLKSILMNPPFYKVLENTREYKDGIEKLKEAVLMKQVE